jgi:hypothetical protein
LALAIIHKPAAPVGERNNEIRRDVGAIMTAAIEFVHKQRDRPDVDPSTMLAAINRKVPVTAADLDVAAIRAKQLGSHLRRTAPPCRGYQPPA